MLWFRHCTFSAKFLEKNLILLLLLLLLKMEIDKLIEGADIVRFIKAQRIKWLGHIQMDQATTTRKLLVWKPMGTRRVGRPRQRLQEGVMEI